MATKELYTPSKEDIVELSADFNVKLSEDEVKQLSLMDVKVPFILKNKRLLSPGVHNGFEYTSNLIRDSVQGTKFTKDNSYMNLNHEDKSVDKWVGEVKNIYYNSSDGSMYGDLWFMDPMTSLKLMLGAKFGMSIKGNGNAFGNKIRSINYENFGVVINPACKTTFLNSEGDTNTSDVEAEHDIKIQVLNDDRMDEIKDEAPQDKGGDAKDDTGYVEEAKGKTDAVDDKKVEEENKETEKKVEPQEKPADEGGEAKEPVKPEVDAEKEELKKKVAEYEEKEKAEAEAKKEAELSEMKKKLEEQSKELSELKERVVKPVGKTMPSGDTSLSTGGKKDQTQEELLNAMSSEELDEAFAELVIAKESAKNVWKV